MAFPQTHADGERWNGAAVTDLEQRVYDATVQRDGTGMPISVPRTVVLAADCTINNNATPANIGIAFPIAVNERWYWNTLLDVTAASTNADWQFGLTGPTGATAIWSQGSGGNSAWVNVGTTLSPVGTKTIANVVSAGALAADHFLTFAGWVQADASHAGTINFQMAQNVAAGENNIIKAGSLAIITRVI